MRVKITGDIAKGKVLSKHPKNNARKRYTHGIRRDLLEKRMQSRKLRAAQLTAGTTTLTSLLGLDKIEPMVLPKSISSDISADDVDMYKEWLESEINSAYEQI
ncbi:hypothetical protein [Paenibacillus campi]|uniref:hypothetical protein n=1 Tax=Paenibacillus campi TaxID=3106031 RepID=UPI002AFFCBC3|nr:hypothetical protein [Paenibacillus sp. SGZ-1014]